MNTIITRGVSIKSRSLQDLESVVEVQTKRIEIIYNVDVLRNDFYLTDYELQIRF